MNDFLWQHSIYFLNEEDITLDVCVVDSISLAKHCTAVTRHIVILLNVYTLEISTSIF